MAAQSFLFFTFFLLFLATFSGYWDSKDRYLGKIPIPVTANVYFKVYQSSDVKLLTSISCEIVRLNDSLIASRHYLTGTSLYEKNTSNFYAGEYDDIIYLTYHSSNEVVGIYDLKSGVGYPFYRHGLDDEQSLHIANTLIRRLQQHNEKLTAHWSRPVV